jgi:hypothetical protein
MDTVSVSTVAQVDWRGARTPTSFKIASRVAYWRNRIYLVIGELSLTWPVAAFLRSL